MQQFTRNKYILFELPYKITIVSTNSLHDKYTLYAHEIMETLELSTRTNFSQYLNLYSKVYPRYMPAVSSVTWDKGGKISEGVFNLAQFLKKNQPNHYTETCRVSDLVLIF